MPGGGRESSIRAAEAPSGERGIAKADRDADGDGAEEDGGEETESSQEREGWNPVAVAKREPTVLDTRGETRR